MSVTLSATLERRSEPIIGIYRRPADCAARLGPRAAPVASRRPNYVVRRAVVLAVVALIVLVTIMALSAVPASLGGGSAAAAEAAPRDSSAPTVHVARSGDTLWAIASQYRGEVDHDRYVDALVRLNGGAAIQIGQAVRLP